MCCAMQQCAPATPVRHSSRDKELSTKVLKKQATKNGIALHMSSSLVAGTALRSAALQLCRRISDQV